MFKRSRNKIILSIMGSLVLLFAVTLSVIMIASYREVRNRSFAMLERYVEQYYLGERPDGQGRPMPGLADMPGAGAEGSTEAVPVPPPDQGRPPFDEGRDFQLSTFYSVALSEDGDVLDVDTGDKAVYGEDELVEIAREILGGSASSGRRGNLLYSISRRDDYTLVAMMDNTVSESGLNTLLRNVLTIGSAAIILLFFISLHLSNQIIRPLEENDRQQKRFISDASHELKTPVAVIGANAELLSREIGENEWLANIQYENERMGDLVKQLLDLSRAENSDVSMEPVDFSRVVTGEMLAFESLAFDQGKSIRCDIDEGIRLTGNQAQLAQLTSILLDNAVRHSTGGEIELSLKRQAHAAVLSVANEGDDIPPEKLGHLFDRFYRVDEARCGEGQHYGLGLSIAKAVAEKHGGSISAESMDGKIRFTVQLPCKDLPYKDLPCKDLSCKDSE